MNELVQNLEDWLRGIKSVGGEIHELIIQPPASDDEIKNAERYLEFPLPSDFASALRFSSRLEFEWSLPDELELPEKFSGICCGELHWGLDLIESHYERYKGWIEVCFPNPEDSYDVVWHNKFPFQEVSNGDFLGIELEKENYGKVIYLSHDDGEGHGHVMANSFSELLQNWGSLGCPGAEDWQWLPFTNQMNSTIDPRCSAAMDWKNNPWGEW